MKRVLLLLMMICLVGAFTPSCEAEPNAPVSNTTPIEPDGEGGEDNGDENEDEESEEDTPENDPLAVEIPNWDFEQEVDFAGKGSWIKQEGWHGYNAEVTYEPTAGYKGSACVRIKCLQETTDLPVAQEVSGLKTGKLYELSAMIKTASITKGWGGNVCLYGPSVWTRSDKFIGTNGWQKRSVLFIAEEESVSVGIRLGFSAGDSNGTAWFDDVKLGSPSGLYHRESEHVEIYLDEALVTIPNNKIDAWLAQLDQAYEAYCELFPFFKPFKGNKMIILNDDIDAWAYAGYPILWNRNYVKSTLIEVNNYNNACFGILHEMGHNFAPGNYRDGKFATSGGNYNMWNWNEELFANFRMYYALDKCNLPIYLDGKVYMGTEIGSKYSKDAANSWDNNNDLDGAGMMWPLCQLVEKYGWEPFIATFEELYNIDQSESAGDSKWSKINYFMQVFSKHAGTSNALSEVLSSEQISRLQSWG